MARRKLRRHIAWRVDADYRAALDPAELAYLEQFEREYYDGDFRGSPVHPPELRRDCYRRAYSARSDAPTAVDVSPKTAARPPQRHRYYDPTDWHASPRNQTANELDETFAEALDREAA